MKIRIPGIYENGEIKLSIPPPIVSRQEVIVTFLDENNSQNSKRGKRTLGQLERQKLAIPEDFNQPLDDLKDYM